MKIFFLIIFMLTGISAKALVGVENLEKKLFEANAELQALRQNVQAREALYSATASIYLPSISAVGGWAQNKTDDLATAEKGNVAYLEGRYNLFNGFKDHALRKQRQIEFHLAELELQAKKKELRTELTQIISQMILLHQLQIIIEDEYNTTQLQKKMASKKVSAGLTGSVDNLEFQLRESEIEIERNQIEQQHSEAHQQLIKLLGEDLTDDELSLATFENAADLTHNKKEFSADANLEIQRARLTLEKSESAKSEVRSDFLPRLDFTFNVGRLTPSEATPLEYNENRYAVLLTIPLFSGFDTYFRTKSATQEIRAAETSLLQKNNDITAAFGILKTRLHELSRLYKINEAKLQIAQKYFDLTLAEYKRGVKNSPDLVSATERLYSSKKKKNEILKELEILKIKIENI